MKTGSGYLGQLDGLRTLSVAAVAWSHWRRYWDSSPPLFPTAELGVETFFVISGFLITGILLSNRSEATRPLVLKHFYIRRFLRIFPLFYATLALALLLHASAMAETWYWHAAYLSNICFYLSGWCGDLGHFWSLAVEEQFYLVWPLLILTLPARYLRLAISLCIVVAPFYALAMNVAHPGFLGQVTASVLMPSCMSALGMGALLALASREPASVPALTRTLLGLGLIGMTLSLAYGSPDWLKPFSRLAEDCLLGWLVAAAANSIRGPLGWFLQCPPMRYLGKISYGLYIIHNFANHLVAQSISWLRMPPSMAHFCQLPAVRVLLLISTTIGLASLSWHLFESRINNLKRRFPYPVKPAVSLPVNPV
jgi:peptidoglycan/LPS O-acetylase OafA/YrhL